MARSLARAFGLCVLALLALQLFFVGRIACMAAVNPSSTTFERSEAMQLWRTQGRVPWRQAWTPYERISDHLKRAVIASEDGSFVNHDGVDWDAIEKAWEKNTRAQAQAAARAQTGRPARPPRVAGGSTITQQLAKNLLLSGERTLLRKGQELLLTYALEALLSKQRILELYLNHVEWGQGIFGAEAAAQHYFGKSAARLTAWEAARLAVMLPAPKRFEKRPASPYLSTRAQAILGRMEGVALP
jgi:monofunctional glycosyltransferase